MTILDYSRFRLQYPMLEMSPFHCYRYQPGEIFPNYNVYKALVSECLITKEDILLLCEEYLQKLEEEDTVY